MRQEVVFGNEPLFREKLDRIKKGGLARLHVVADFDRTLTKGRSDAGEHENTSPGLLSVPGFVHAEIRRGKHEMFQKYRPIELDTSMSVEEKIPHMVRWLKDSERLYVDHKLSREQIRTMARSDLITPREWFNEYFDFLHERDVPQLIFSAGIGDFIEEYLKYHHVDYPNVHLVANRFMFDENGFVTGWKNEVITTTTKNEAHAAFDVARHDIIRRPNVLLLGDNAADIHMADGAKHETVLSIGFLNGQRTNLEDHMRTFDAVIPRDVGLDIPIKILKEIGEVTVP